MAAIGFVGLGKMGGNMVARIRRDSEHDVVAFDFDKAAVKRAVGTGATGASSLADLVKKRVLLRSQGDLALIRAPRSDRKRRGEPSRRLARGALPHAGRGRRGAEGPAKDGG